jgi:hypothetical protein
LYSFEQLCLEAYGDANEEATIHYVKGSGSDSGSDDDDESSDGQVSDAESILGSLIGSDCGSDCGSDRVENSDDESDTLAKSESCTALTDNELEEDLDFDSLTISVKAKANNYAEQVAELPKISDETKAIIDRALSKFDNPLPCPECGKLLKNERGVKLHMTKMH